MLQQPVRPCHGPQLTCHSAGPVGHLAVPGCPLASGPLHMLFPLPGSSLPSFTALSHPNPYSEVTFPGGLSLTLPPFTSNTYSRFLPFLILFFSVACTTF